MHLQFSPGGWSMDALTYAYSYRFEQTPVFVQKSDCVENRPDETVAHGFDNITLLTRERLSGEVEITTHCDFEALGAPLIVLTPALEADARGVLRYGDYLEVVLYRDGINVWKLWRQDGAVSWKRLLGAQFPLAENQKHRLSVKISADTLHICADEHKFSLLVNDMYPAFHAGITACEGINRFYDLQISP